MLIATFDIIDQLMRWPVSAKLRSKSEILEKYHTTNSIISLVNKTLNRKKPPKIMDIVNRSALEGFRAGLAYCLGGRDPFDATDFERYMTHTNEDLN